MYPSVELPPVQSAAGWIGGSPEVGVVDPLVSGTGVAVLVLLVGEPGGVRLTRR
jgi:hypothetical protein